jgi:hypothetical protein
MMFHCKKDLLWNSRLFSWISDFTMFCQGCMLEFHDAVHDGSTLIFVFYSVHPEFLVIQHEFTTLKFFPGLWSWVGPPPGGSSKVQNSSHDLPVYPCMCTWDFKVVPVFQLGHSYCRPSTYVVLHLYPFITYLPEVAVLLTWCSLTWLGTM